VLKLTAETGEFFGALCRGGAKARGGRAAPGSHHRPRRTQRTLD
jgi:hypothetical protein